MIGHRFLFALVALSLLSAGGCYSMYPYGMQPGMYGPQGMYGQQGAMVPPGPGAGQVTYLDATPTVAAGAVTSPVDQNLAPNSATSQPGISREPVRAPNIQSGPAAGSGGVPEPRDPSPSAAGGQSAVRTSEGVLDIGTNLTRVSPDEPVFLKPVVMTENGAGKSVIPAGGTVEALVATQPQSDLARDPNYRWVQGDLQYDVQRRSWHLVYDYTPFDDRFGGELTLSGNLPFTPSDNDRVYRVYGTFDRTQADQLGKPVYRVSSVQRMSR
ncbi:MAG: hypothetical protein O2820_18255 [Planctomycetota bacterium]|nr:hypothetical protein [Planctomycetota bacterium]MDA1251163.1 hypothetical protein [Planctomycetota bacterium]